MYSEATGSSIVTLKVGPELKKFRVHKALLLKHSEYFRKALRGSWTEAKEGVVKIDDIEPAVGMLLSRSLFHGNPAMGISDLD